MLCGSDESWPWAPRPPGGAAGSQGTPDFRSSLTFRQTSWGFKPPVQQGPRLVPWRNLPNFPGGHTAARLLLGSPCGSEGRLPAPARARSKHRSSRLCPTPATLCWSRLRVVRRTLTGPPGRAVLGGAGGEHPPPPAPRPREQCSPGSLCLYAGYFHATYAHVSNL